MNQLVQTLSRTTMTSIEMVEFINEQRIHEDEPVLLHKNFLAKVPSVLGCELAKTLAGQRKAGNGQMQPCYNFPKREACLMAMSYSYELQAKVFDRMTELEFAQATPVANLSDASTLRELLLGYTEQVIALEAKVEAQKPAVAFVERYVESTGNKNFREVCKLLNANEARFSEYLIENKIMYRLSGRLTAMANHLDAGRFEVKAGIGENGHSFTATKFTPKGINWIAGLWAIHNLNS